jgi:hypothetical protein
MISQDRLATYLTDHLAGSEFARDLAKRAASKTEGTDLGTFLQGLAGEIEADRKELVMIMNRFGIQEGTLKKAAGSVLEKLSRVKFEELDDESSYLNRLLELEALLVGIEGKAALWRALKVLAPSDDRLAESDYDRLSGRAQQQLSELEQHRQAIVPRAFA